MAVVWWQAILNFLGAVLAFLYRYVPNYGVAIILFTVAVRVVLLPLAIKQIRSMQAMQVIQPKVKELQQRYKKDRQRLTEETMKLYREHGVNPVGGCLPMVMQLPILFALYAILRVPGGIVHIPHSEATARVVSPANSRLYNDILSQRTGFLGTNLLCSAGQSGQKVPVTTKKGEPRPIIKGPLDCGSGGASRVPYYVLALVMGATMYYQQRQMQRASPGAVSAQQQTLTRIMPLLFLFWGYLFPAGLVLYWTVTNLIQIGQQHFMLPRGTAGERMEWPEGDGQRRDRRPGPAGRGTGSPRQGGARLGRPRPSVGGARTGGPAGERSPRRGGGGGSDGKGEGRGKGRAGSWSDGGSGGGSAKTPPRPGRGAGGQQRGRDSGGLGGGGRKKRRKR